MDPLIGNEQKAGAFWKRITDYYNASPKVVGLAPREQTHYKHRWGKINEGVCKFVGSFEAATKQRTSGQNEDDVLKAAHEIFFNDYKVKFSLEHAWMKLRNDHKWCGTQGSSQQSSGLKRKRFGVVLKEYFQSSAFMPSVNGENEAMDRPIGIKAAKAKAKRSVGEKVKIPQGFKDMWEKKANDLAFKDKLSNKKLLDSLISKKEPLTELEVALKNKLITEMGTSHTPPAMEARKPIVCGLSARGKIPPPLPQEDTDDDVADVTPSEVEVVEISDEEEAEWVEESEDDLEPEFRRLLQRIHEEEKKLKKEKFKAMKSGIKLEEGQSSKVDVFPFHMAFSSQNPFDGLDDQSFDDAFDQYFDQQFDQTFKNLTINYGHQEKEKKQRKKRAYIERNREKGHIRLWNDYFSETPTYPANMFRRRFIMNRPLFMHIVERISNEVEFFQQKTDALGRFNLFPLQKCTAAIRVLAYGTAADAVDEYLRLGETTTRLCVEHFVESIIYLFGEEYLRRPTPTDLQRLLDIGEHRGFPGMIGIIDCQAPQVIFSVNEREYHMTYYLTDGIYPKWATFIQSISIPQGPKAVLFAQQQEAVRKDVERAFGVLQARFAIVKNSAFFWDKGKIEKIIRACIILHNMIVEGERDGYTQYDVSEFQQGKDTGSSHVNLTFSTDIPTNIGNIMGA
uniref:No apical meristem-associated C-terminal domain-containing protein n=1 Tax=Brassica oleracea var. oleracea TaxID=109376 RepID=A0A0D3BC02_BRAOL